MVISSVVVTVKRGCLPVVSEAVSKLSGIDVFAHVEQESKLILVLESETLESSHHLVTNEIEKISGVLNVQLAYCHFEENTLQQEEMQPQ
ncbi:chaperone NapD [Desulfitobacterium sp. Sab5]|uniref:chaperone NapD n=1 Tax=Desulfitobacterium nosdiversum TaxID=3375356 RepID=UPI003CF3CBBA